MSDRRPGSYMRGNTVISLMKIVKSSFQTPKYHFLDRNQKLTVYLTYGNVQEITYQEVTQIGKERAKFLVFEIFRIGKNRRKFSKILKKRLRGPKTFLWWIFVMNASFFTMFLAFFGSQPKSQKILKFQKSRKNQHRKKTELGHFLLDSAHLHICCS